MAADERHGAQEQDLGCECSGSRQTSKDSVSSCDCVPAPAVESVIQISSVAVLEVSRREPVRHVVVASGVVVMQGTDSVLLSDRNTQNLATDCGLAKNAFDVCVLSVTQIRGVACCYCSAGSS